MKTILLFIAIILLGIFFYLKIQVMGSPTSHFNQTTRFSIGRSPFWRGVLGLHNPGDAKAEYLLNTQPLLIEWFEPDTENINSGIVQQFANMAGRYTGRPIQVVFGGAVSTGTINLSDLDNLVLRNLQKPTGGGSVMFVVFTEDYQPRPTGQLSTTHEDSSVVISLNAEQQFLASYPQDVNNYSLFSMLRGFGSQIGLLPNSDLSCIMGPGSGVNGQTLEAEGQSIPQDFCPVEVQQIANIKASLQ